MRGPDIQGAGGKGLHSGLLTFKPQREAGWTARSPAWLRLRSSPAAHYPPCPQRHQMPASLRFPMPPPSTSLTAARVEGTVTTGEGLKGDSLSCPPLLFFLLSADPFITEEPQFFSAPGAGDSTPPSPPWCKPTALSRCPAHGWAWLGGHRVVPMVYTRLCI